MIKWTKKQEKVWEDWLWSRPPIIQKMCKDFPPNQLYELKSTGHVIKIIGYCEDKTFVVGVLSKYNPNVIVDRKVFGIKAKDIMRIN